MKKILISTFLIIFTKQLALLTRKDFNKKDGNNLKENNLLERTIKICSEEDCALKRIGKRILQRIKKRINLKGRVSKYLNRSPETKQKPQIIYETKIIKSGTHDYSKNKTIIINKTTQAENNESQRELSYIKNYPGNVIKSKHKINYDDYARRNSGFVEKNYDKTHYFKRRDTTENRCINCGGGNRNFSENNYSRSPNFINDRFGNNYENRVFNIMAGNYEKKNGYNSENQPFNIRGKFNVTTSGNRKYDIKRVAVSSNVNGDIKKKEYVFRGNDGCNKGSTYYRRDERCVFDNNRIILSGNRNNFGKKNLDYLGSSLKKD